MKIISTFKLNSEQVVVEVAPSTRLSSVLRNELGHTGTKVGCDAGDCGACSVMIDGRVVCACMVPVAQVEGCNIITVEGVACKTQFGKALQDAFLAYGAVQCGICTPGMLVAAAAFWAATVGGNL